MIPTAPSLGSRVPASMLITVDLPAPLGPIIAVMYPGRSENDTPLTAVRLPKFLVRPSTTTSGDSDAQRGQRRPVAVGQDRRVAAHRLRRGPVGGRPRLPPRPRPRATADPPPVARHVPRRLRTRSPIMRGIDDEPAAEHQHEEHEQDPGQQDLPRRGVAADARADVLADPVLHRADDGRADGRAERRDHAADDHVGDEVDRQLHAPAVRGGVLQVVDPQDARTRRPSRSSGRRP